MAFKGFSTTGHRDARSHTEMGSEWRAGGRLALGLQHNSRKQANALAMQRVTGVVSPTSSLGISRLLVCQCTHLVT